MRRMSVGLISLFRVHRRRCGGGAGAVIKSRGTRSRCIVIPQNSSLRAAPHAARAYVAPLHCPGFGASTRAVPPDCFLTPLWISECETNNVYMRLFPYFGIPPPPRSPRTT